MVLVAGGRALLAQPMQPNTTDKTTMPTVTMSLIFINTALQSGFAA
ncbi:hypothetical protein I546_3451 [Mycobacterium kansasii 732]|nr:hypothetical protein I546_3451 [Mycobacterium kansasii 732]